MLRMICLAPLVLTPFLPIASLAAGDSEGPPPNARLVFDVEPFSPYTGEVTASGDKPGTVSVANFGRSGRRASYAVWDADTGDNLLSLVPEIGGVGALPREVERSPDGKHLAVAMFGETRLVRLADRLFVWKSYGDSGTSWSPDGRYIGAADCTGIAGSSAPRQCLLRAADGAVVRNEVLPGVPLKELSWSASGKAAAVCDDSRACILEAGDFGLRLLHGPALSDVERVRLSPDGKRLAIARRKPREVVIVSADDLGLLSRASLDGLEFKPPPKTPGTDCSHCLFLLPRRYEGVRQLIWSSDGKILRAWIEHHGYDTLRSWGHDGLLAAADIRPTRGKIVLSVRSDGGGVVLASYGAEHGWEILQSDGSIDRVNAQSAWPNRRTDLRLSEDARTVVFSVPRRGRAVERRGLTIPGGPIASLPELDAGLTDEHALKFTKEAQDERATLGEAVLPLRKSDPRVWLPDRSRLFVAMYRQGRSQLARIRSNGASEWERYVPSVSALAVSRDGRWLVAACQDGTFRWHRAHDGKEVLAVFLHGNGVDWLAWTPAGYFAGARSMEKYLGWVVGHESDASKEFVPVSGFRERYRRPDVVDAALANPESPDK